MDPHAAAHLHKSGNDVTNAPGPIVPDRAHHISEFGEVENLKHIDSPIRPSVEDEQPAPPPSHKGRVALNERLRRLRRKCFHERHIHQYWQGETLFRTEGSRKVGSDELFLDLVIVGGVAALGHELRETFGGWDQVEKFILLFGALYSSWRAVVFLWNLWGLASDLIDKFGIYLVFTCLTFIALGAHGAFDSGPRPYVAVASFLATAIPTMSNVIFGTREPLLHVKRSISQLALSGLTTVLASTPYFAAAFVSSGRAVRILYWAALIANLLTPFLTTLGYRTIFRSAQHQTRLAISIELFVEKYEVLTMIVLGESVLGLLFEGATIVTAEGVRLGALFGWAAVSTGMLYALQTLYNNVDAPITKGGKHALRYRKLHGLLWSQLHVPYHAALILFATGLGIVVRDIAMPEVYDGHVRTVMDATRIGTAIVSAGLERAESSGAKEVIMFDEKVRWLFSAGWGASILLSGLIGSLHEGGPRAATKRWRLLIRFIVVIPITIGMPFADIDPEYFLIVFAVVLICLALGEYVCVQMDKMGFFRSEATILSSSTDDIDDRDVVFGDERDVDDDNLKNGDVEEGLSKAHNFLETQVNDDHVKEALRARLCKSHVLTLVPASRKRCEKERNVGVDLG